MEEIGKDLEQKQNEKNNEVPAIRTYKGDVANFIKKEGKTLADIAIAEQNRKSRGLNAFETDNSNQKASYKKIILAIIFLLLSGVIIMLFFFLKNKYFSSANSQNNQAQTTATPNTFEFGIKSKDLDLTNLNKDYVVGKIDNALKDSSEIFYLNITNEDQKISIKTLLESLDIYVPSELIRSLKNTFALGSLGGSARFLILKTTYYPNAFAGMLKWENTIYKDLGEILDLKKETVDIKGTTTASYNLKPATFYDTIISNRDSRILKDGVEKTLLIYSFIDNETIAIASNENVLKILSEKLVKKR
jgi:hypothetical protein